MCKRDGFLQVVTGSSEVTGTVQREEEKLFLGNSGFGCCALMSNATDQHCGNALGSPEKRMGEPE